MLQMMKNDRNDADREGYLWTVLDARQKLFWQKQLKDSTEYSPVAGNNDSEEDDEMEAGQVVAKHQSCKSWFGQSHQGTLHVSVYSDNVENFKIKLEKWWN